MKHYVEPPRYSTGSSGAWAAPKDYGGLTTSLAAAMHIREEGLRQRDQMLASIPKSNNPLDYYMPPEQIGHGKRTYGSPIVSDDMSGLAPAPQSVPTTYIHDPGATRAPWQGGAGIYNTDEYRRYRGIGPV